MCCESVLRACAECKRVPVYSIVTTLHLRVKSRNTCPCQASSYNYNNTPALPACTLPPLPQINVIEKSMDQMVWFRDNLKAASTECDAVVVGGHHAVYSSGQHARSTRQQDLTTRLNFPGAFQWAGA